ncbi:MAG: BlaI/MecI/CopY family transcriptional regulator [Acidimicrobiales bacterium]
MASAAGSCDNPVCTCTPCGCGAGCRCGSVRLRELEQQVMEVLWDAGGAELSARAVRDRLGSRAPTTIATTLERLSRKGIVRRRHEGRSVRFSATTSRAEHVAVLMREALWTTAAPEDALAEFVRRANPTERAALARAVDGGPGLSRPRR